MRITSIGFERGIVIFLSIAALAIHVLRAETAKSAPASLNTWLVLGAFKNNESVDLLDRTLTSASVAPPKIGGVAGEKQWCYFDDRLFSRNYDDYVDLFSYFKFKRRENTDSVAVYLHTYFFSPDERDAQIRAGADKTAKVWVNGNPVLDVKPGENIRDSAQADIRLAAGWNRLLVRVGNTEDGRLGCYIRVCDPEGNPMSDIVASVQNPALPFEILAPGMPEIGSNPLPDAWREWPYVSAFVDPEKVYPPEDPAFRLFFPPKDIPGFIHGTNLNASLPKASPLVLQCQGGRPPYIWNISWGELPKGLSLTENGQLVGTIGAEAELKKYNFEVHVTDAIGQTVRKPLSLEVRERPNKWYEEGRLVGLMHMPEVTPPGGAAGIAQTMKDQGYILGIPISYNNGDKLFRWPSRFAKPGTADDIGDYKKALEGKGMRFGMYMGNLNVGDPKLKSNEQPLMVAEAMERYHPAVFWFDWCGKDADSVDALYSVIRTLNPELVIVLNGVLRASNGDWDVLCFEGAISFGERKWEIWPAPFHWFKKPVSESWRFIACRPFFDNDPDWQQLLRVQISLIGEGYVADMDHSIAFSDAGTRGSEESKPRLASLEASPQLQINKRMAEWASPLGIPSLYESYTWVNPGPLDDGFWGYDMINLRRDTIYVHALKNPRGKRGLPPEKTLTVGPVTQKVKSVIWMNKNQAIPFSQAATSTDKSVTLDISGVEADPVDTIFKIELESPIGNEVAPKTGSRINLALQRPSRMLSLDGKRELMESAQRHSYMGVDGTPETSAVAAWEYPWIYEVDLGRIHRIGTIVFATSKAQFATVFDLQVSIDGKSWETVGKGEAEAPGRNEIDLLEPTEGRYVRVRGIKPDGPDQKGIQMAIGELEVFSAP